MGEFSLADILDEALAHPPSKAPKESPRRQPFDYAVAIPDALEDAVRHVKARFGGPRGKQLGSARTILDEIDVLLERIVVGKLSRLQPKDIEKWFVRGSVKQPDGRLLRMSQVHTLVRGINSTVGQLDRLDERRRLLEVREVMEGGKVNERVVRSLERADSRKGDLETRLARLTMEFLNTLSSVAMLVAQE